MLVGIEFVISDQGLGYLIEQGRTLLLLEQSYVSIILVAIIGYLFALSVKLLGRILIPWASDDNILIVAWTKKTPSRPLNRIPYGHCLRGRGHLEVKCRSPPAWLQG